MARLGGGEAAGKTMGLSAYGNYCQKYYDFLELCTGEMQDRGGTFYDQNILSLAQNISPADIAFTMQQYTLDKIEEVLIPLKTSKNICVAGGVAYNGYMNELLTKHYKNVFVPPAVGDEGQSLGTYMHAAQQLNNEIHIQFLHIKYLHLHHQLLQLTLCPLLVREILQYYLNHNPKLHQLP